MEKGTYHLFADKPRDRWHRGRCSSGHSKPGATDGDHSPGKLPDAITALTNHMDSIHWLFRTDVEPHQLIPAIADQLRQATGGLPTSVMREIVSTTTAEQDFNAQLLSPLRHSRSF